MKTKNYFLWPLACFIQNFIFAQDYFLERSSHEDFNVHLSQPLNHSFLSMCDLTLTDRFGLSAHINQSIARSQMHATDAFSSSDSITFSSNGSKFHLQFLSDPETQYAIDATMFFEKNDDIFNFNINTGSHLRIEHGLIGPGQVLKTGEGSFVVNDTSQFTGLALFESGYSNWNFSPSSIVNTDFEIKPQATLEIGGLNFKLQSDFFYNDGLLNVNTPLYTVSYIQNPLYGTGSMIKSGSGTLVLDQAHFLDSGIKIEEGVLVLKDLAIGGDIQLASNATVIFDNHLDRSYRDAIFADTQSVLIKRGLGHLVFMTSLPVLSQPIEVQQGGLTIFDSAFADTSIAVAPDASLSFNLNQSHTLTKEIFAQSGSELLKFGLGDLSFSFPVSFSSVKIYEGSLSLNQVYQYGSIFNHSRMYVDIPQGITNNLYSSLSGNGDFYKIGAGQLDLYSGDYHGTIFLERGSLVIHDGFIPKNIHALAETNLLFDIEKHLTLSGDLNSDHGVIKKHGSGSLILLSSQSYRPTAFQIQQGTLVLYDKALVDSVLYQNSAKIQLVVENPFSTTAVVSGSGSFEKYGLEALHFTEAQTYSGPTFLNEGTLIYSGAGTITDQTDFYTAPLTVANFSESSAAIILKSLHGYGTLILGNKNIQIGRTGDAQTPDCLYGGTIQTSGYLVKRGLNNWTLAGKSTILAGVFLEEGALIQTIAQSFDPSALYLANNTHIDLNGYNLEVTSLAGFGQIYLSSNPDKLASFILNNENSNVFYGSIRGYGHFLKKGNGLLRLEEQLENTNTVEIQQGQLVFSPSTYRLGSENSELVLGLYGSVDLQNKALSVGAVSGSGSLYLGSGSLITGTNNNNTDFNGHISGTGSITKVGSGSWTVSSQLSYTGLTNIYSGAVVQGISQIIPATNSVFLDANTLWDLNGYDLEIAALEGAGTIQLNQGNLIFNIQNQTNVFSGSIISNIGQMHGSVYKKGSGTLVFAGKHQYTGDTYIQAGTLKILLNDSLPDQNTLHIASDATFEIDQTVVFDRIKSILSVGTVVLNNQKINLDGSGAVSHISGTLIGSPLSSIFLTNGANLTLNSTGLFEGLISIDSHSQIKIQAQSTGYNLINSGAIIFDTSLSSQSLISDASISGTGAVYKRSPGTLEFQRDLIYTGDTFIQKGAINLKNINLKTQKIHLTSGTVLNYNGIVTNQWDLDYSLGGTGTVNYNLLPEQTIQITAPQTLTASEYHIQSGHLVWLGTSFDMSQQKLVINQDATAHAIETCFYLLDNTDFEGVLSLSESLIQTPGDVSSVALSGLANTNNLIYQNGLHISNQNYLQAIRQDMYLYTNIIGDGGFSVSGPKKIFFLPPNQVEYLGATQIQSGALYLNEKFFTSSEIQIASEAALHLKLSSDFLNQKNFLSSITGAGKLYIDQGDILLSGMISVLGDIYIDPQASLSVTTNFKSNAAIYSTGTESRGGVMNITIPDGETFEMKNNYYGYGEINKYGPGNLIMRGDFSGLFGRFVIHDGSVSFSKNIHEGMDVIGNYNLINIDSAVLTLRSNVVDTVFGGMVTGVRETRFRLIGRKDHGRFQIKNFVLSGILDIQQLKEPDIDAVFPEPQFYFENFSVNNGAGINFQFDQTDASGNLRAFLSYAEAQLPQSLYYSLQPIKQTDVYQDRKYRLLELQSPTREEMDFLVYLANNLEYPVIFSVTPELIYNTDNQKMVLDIAVTKYDAGTVVKRSQKPISITIAGAANRLQQLGLSDAYYAKNATQVLENAKSPEDLFAKINNLTPSGNKKPDQALTPSQSQSTANSTLSSMRFNALAAYMNKLQGSSYIPTYLKDTKVLNQNRRVSNKMFANLISKIENESHFQFQDIVDSLELSGLSVSLETNYVHQRVKLDDPEPDRLINAWGSTLGATKSVKDSLICGVLGSYLGRRIEMDKNNLSKTAKTYERVNSIAVFCAYQDWEYSYYLSSYFSFGHHNYHSQRTWNHPIFDEDKVISVFVPSYADSYHSGYDTTSNFEAGYTYIINQELALQPFIGAGFVNLTERSYFEKSYNQLDDQPNEFGNYMPQHSVTKQSRTFGMQAIQSIVDNLTAYQFSLRASYVTDKLNGGTTTFRYGYLYSPYDFIDLVAINKRMSALETSLGFNMATADSWILSLTYTGHFGSNMVSHTVVGTWQYSFA